MATNGNVVEGSKEGVEFGDPLERLETASSIVMSKDMFEKLYLSPHNKVSGDLRKTFANPTPVGLGGILLTATPLVFDLLGWRAAGAGEGNTAASIGSYYFLGGLLGIMTAVGEFILGNTFSMVFLGGFGGYFLSIGATLQPSFNASTAYDPSDPTLALQSPAFLSSSAFCTLSMSIFVFVMFICALRTNIVLLVLLGTLQICFCFEAAGNWKGAEGDFDARKTYNIVAGSFGFVGILGG